MAAPILATKLYLPPPGHHLVHGQRLIERPYAGMIHAPLTLISAPSGFGKTTLVSESISSCEQPTACLTSLDEGENL